MSEEQTQHLWVAVTFTGILSNLGGYSTVLAGFFALLIGNYQSFVFDKSMLKKLYFQQSTEHSANDEEGY